MLCDSNRRYLNIKKLYPKNNTKSIPCGTTKRAIDVINDANFNVKKGIVINTIEHLPADVLINNQVHLVNLATKAFPQKKIILSSVTPRKDSLDRVVGEVNHTNAIHEKIKDMPHVFHVNNGNLRHNHFYHDVKHLNKKFGIPKLAANIKKEIRLASQPRQQTQQEMPTPQNQPRESIQSNTIKPVQHVTPTLIPMTDVPLRQQLCNITSLLSKLIETNVEYQQQRVMYNPGPVPLYNTNL